MVWFGLVCPICEKAIRRSQANAQCSICDLYVHLSCLGAEFEQSKRCSLCCDTIPPSNNTDESPLALFPEFVDAVKTRGLKIVHQNIQSITKKINELRLICSSVQSGIHFITLSETWLNEQILDCEISIEGYKVFRLDRANKGDLNSTNVSVSEISSPNHPNPTTRFNKPSYPNTQTPKHLVPCPFLRRKRHCVKGSKCDFSHTVDSHRPLQSGPRGFSSHFRVPSPYLGDFPHSVDSQRPLQFGPSGFPSPFREPSPYPGPLFPPAISHPLMNHSYANPFIQTLQTLQPLMDMPTRTIRY